jgi:GntR family transcriptional regulator
MEFNREKSIFLQIADMVCDNILSRRWKNGDRILSVREMAVAIEVNPNTVLRTYTYLQEKGILSNKRGIGYFASDDAYRNALKYKKDEFLNHDLPRFSRTLRLLGMDLDDIKVHLKGYSKRRLPGEDI